ncbi:hypothetical protein P0Y35_06915 [Kiritimatiellaeota bacterium B1221]|nr:hypothetical protein [Kiritimatiellaeota bacterium B1221]
MTFIIFVLILACVAGAFFLNRKAKAQRASVSPAAFVLVGLALLLVLVKLFGFKQPDPSERALMHVTSYQTAQGVVAGRKVAERHPGSRVTILLPPKAYGLYRATEGLDALRDALVEEMEKGGLQVQVKQIPLPPASGEQSLQDVSADELDPASEESAAAMGVTQRFMAYYTTPRFSKIVRDQTDADVVVCLFDLPMALEGRGLPRKGPALVMMYDNVDALAPALRSTVLDAVVLPQNPGKVWDYEQSLPRTAEAGFAKWFLWVTPESMDTIDHPALR